MTAIPGKISAEDLVPDRALRDTDVDAFNHTAIVTNLASHVEFGEGPLNIALFGAWGAGKSSVYELLAKQLDARPVRTVRYDAWRFGGEALQRNFISHAADQLDFPASKHREYHEGLFESRRHADIDLRDLEAWKSPMTVFGIVLVGLLVTVTLIALGVSYLTDRSQLEQIGAVLSGFFIPAAVGALVVAAIKAVLDGATITVDQSRPSSDDQFTSRFNRLIGEARSRHAVDKIVFFIDELDRCSPDEVVSTLTAVKTFLGSDDCVFVVAADRQALEQALTLHLKQATPADEDHPYYSSASSFLDKVFHHQIYLPPLRPVSLTGFARDLVSNRGGLWKEIRDEGGQRLLDDVIYALIPSHVVSPRRVKVLLNNFASNVRIAESRALSWRSRSLEIAKLTVLQTEFPNLARDLTDAPNLPELLLGDGRENGKLPQTVQRLVERHSLLAAKSEDPNQELDAPDDDSAAEAPDPIVQSAATASPARGRAIQTTQKRNLRRYLERCQARDIPSPRRDLLYLASVGPLHGLIDWRLAEQLESDAREAPNRVVEALDGRSAEEREAAANILADLSRHEFGGEKANCISAMLGAANAVTLHDGTSARLVAALADFLAADNVKDSELVSVLRIGLRGAGPEASGLAQRILKTDGLFDDLGRVYAIASMLSELPSDAYQAVGSAVGSFLEHDPDVLIEPLERLDDEFATTLLSQQGVRQAVLLLAAKDDPAPGFDDPESESPSAILERIYDAVSGKTAAIRSLQWLLLSPGRAYPVVRAHADAVLRDAPDRVVCTSHALKGLRWGPAEDRDFWSSYLSPDATPKDWWDREVAIVTVQLLNDPEPVPTPVAVRLSSFVDRLSEPQLDDVVEAIASRLGASAWWASDGAAQAQHAAYEWALALTVSGATSFPADAIRACLDRDFDRIYDGRPAEPHASEDPFGGDVGIRAVGVLAPLLSRERTEQIRDQAQVYLKSEDVSRRQEAAETMLVAIESLVRFGVSPDVPDPAALLSTLSNSDSGRRVAARWLRLRPEAPIVGSLAERVDGAVGGELGSALRDWAMHVEEDERTKAAMALAANTPPSTSWALILAEQGIDEEALVSKVRALAADAPRIDERRLLVKLVVDLHPASLQARKVVAVFIEDLLDRRRQGDFELAERLVPALGQNHQSGLRIREAFDQAALADSKLRIGPKGLRDLRSAGIDPKQRSLSDQAKKKADMPSKGAKNAARSLARKLSGR